MYAFVALVNACVINMEIDYCVFNWKLCWNCWLIKIMVINGYSQEKVRSAAVSGNLDAPEGNTL